MATSGDHTEDTVADVPAPRQRNIIHSQFADGSIIATNAFNTVDIHNVKIPLDPSVRGRL
ncbi:hypothetical protein AB4Z52_34390 [Rhizobium sp. 2YAF20]|uniref:hypothetical protein n=1 Tax=Rhizobium sp. 2YAF20 TaxID=3233027 RepID=UPI003F9911E8